MIEDADSSKGQLLRADHLFHVTLKYTRTGDVIKNMINRLVQALEFSVSEILSRKNIKDVPVIALMRANMLKKRFHRNSTIQELVKFYLHLKKLDKGKYSVGDEYRKNVAIIVDDERIDIPKLREFLDKAKEIVQLIAEIK